MCWSTLWGSTFNFVVLGTSLTGSGPVVTSADVTSPSTSAASSVTGKDKAEPIAAVASATSKTIEQRVRSMESMVSSMRPAAPVEDALHQIRILAARPALTATHVLLAGVELLVEQAALTGHFEAPCYSKALRACREMTTIEYLCSLCLKLFGSAEDKKISSALSELAKSKRYAVSGSSALPYNGFRGQPYNRRFMRPRQFGRPQGPARACFYCKEVGHFVSDCPKIKSDEQLK